MTGGAGPGRPGVPGDSGASDDQGDGPGGERQVPFFCPYCGEEDLRPVGARPGAWDCASCSRGFRLRFTGMLAGRSTS